MTRLLDGKSVGAVIRGEVAAGVREFRERAGRAPGLAVVLVGDDPASKVYVGSKAKACDEAGMRSWTHVLPAATPAVEIEILLARLNADADVDGILVQLPLPKGLPTRALLDRIDPEKDVDGLHPVNVGRLWLDEPGFVPCTPAGIVESLKRHGIALAGRRAVVVGRSAIVGKPMAALLLRENATVTLAHSKTPHLDILCREAELIIAAAGRAGLVGAAHVGEGAVVVDVGMNRIADRSEAERLVGGDATRMADFDKRGYVLVGDVDFPAVAAKVGAITPVPGGVGPLTIAMLLSNTLLAARRRSGLA